MMNGFSRRLKALRLERGLSIVKLAEKIDVTERTLTRWENGASYPRPYYHSKIAEALGVSKEALGLVKDIQSETKIEVNTQKNEDTKGIVNTQNEKSSTSKYEGVLKTSNLNLKMKRKWRTILLLCLLALVILGSGTYYLLYRVLPSKTSSEDKISIQATASHLGLQPSASSFASIIQQGVLVPITFSSSEWDIGEQTSGFCSPVTTRNTMEVVAKKGRGIFSCVLNSTVPNNVALQVQINAKRGKLIGITFRDSTNSLHYYYLYRVNILSGAWDLSEGTGYTQKILSGYGHPQVSNSIAKGNNVINILGVVVMNQTIYLYANKQLIYQITEKPIYGTGTIGMYVGIDPGAVVYSNLTIWKLPQKLRII